MYTTTKSVYNSRSEKINNPQGRSGLQSACTLVVNSYLHVIKMLSFKLLTLINELACKCRVQPCHFYSVLPVYHELLQQGFFPQLLWTQFALLDHAILHRAAWELCLTLGAGVGMARVDVASSSLVLGVPVAVQVHCQQKWAPKFYFCLRQHPATICQQKRSLEEPLVVLVSSVFPGKGTAGWFFFVSSATPRARSKHPCLEFDTSALIHTRKKLYYNLYTPGTSIFSTGKCTAQFCATASFQI